MAASLVQQICARNCEDGGHIGYPIHIATGAGPESGAKLGSGLLCAKLNQSYPATECHSFSTSTAINPISANNHIELIEPRAYPFKGHVKHTHASYRRETIPELSHLHPKNSTTAVVPAGNGHINGGAVDLYRPGKTASATTASKPKVTNGWTLCLPVPVPHGIPNATLESLTYTVRYASFDAGSASVQTDIVLSHGAKIPEGIITDYSKLALYDHSHGCSRNNSGGGKGYGPPMFNEAYGLVLASVPAFKNASSTGGWSHYLDHQKIFPNVRIGEDCAPNTPPSTPSRGQHTSPAAGYHVYLFFHVYEYPDEEALRSISIDASATWNDGTELRRAKEGRERELNEFRMERERLVIMKREMDATIHRLEESAKRANEEHERRIKGELGVEKKLGEHQKEFLALEKKAREAYEARMREEARRLKEIGEADLKAKQHHESRLKEEEQRLKALSEAEHKAELEHARRLKEETQKLKEISEAEQRLKLEHEKRASEEEAKVKELEEKQRRFKEETERAVQERKKHHEHEEAARKVHQEAEAKARRDLEIWTRTQAELKDKEEKERQARVVAERVAREEAEHRLKEIEQKIKEENERRAKEEAERKAREEAERKAREEAERKAKAVPSISEAPRVADNHMQEHIARIAEMQGQKCKRGYAWEKKTYGYKCKGGGHFVSFKDLGMQ